MDSSSTHAVLEDGRCMDSSSTHAGLGGGRRMGRNNIHAGLEDGRRMDSSSTPCGGGGGGLYSIVLGTITTPAKFRSFGVCTTHTGIQAHWYLAITEKYLSRVDKKTAGAISIHFDPTLISAAG